MGGILNLRNEELSNGELPVELSAISTRQTRICLPHYLLLHVSLAGILQAKWSYSTVTLFAKLRGLSMSKPLFAAT